MENHEFFVSRWEAEQPAFSKVLRAVPADKLDYRPHERSTSAGQLAWQLAEEQNHIVELLRTGVIDFVLRPNPAYDEILAHWDKGTEVVREELSKLTAEKCAGPADFKMGGTSVWSDTVGNMLWGYLFDTVHHRGQLSTYLRPMGARVPSIYGPSADDRGE